MPQHRTLTKRNDGDIASHQVSHSTCDDHMQHQPILVLVTWFSFQEGKRLKDVMVMWLLRLLFLFSGPHTEKIAPVIRSFLPGSSHRTQPFLGQCVETCKQICMSWCPQRCCLTAKHWSRTGSSRKDKGEYAVGCSANLLKRKSGMGVKENYKKLSQSEISKAFNMNPLRVYFP